MKKIAAATVFMLLVGTTAFAQQARTLTTLPKDAVTVNNYLKQSVYDPSDKKIGEIEDVLIEKDGKIGALIIGVGGFLEIGEKDVAVAFDSVKGSMKNNKWYLVMNTTKDALKNAPGYKYDKSATTWVPEKK